MSRFRQPLEKGPNGYFLLKNGREETPHVINEEIFFIMDGRTKMKESQMNEVLRLLIKYNK